MYYVCTKHRSVITKSDLNSMTGLNVKTFATLEAAEKYENELFADDSDKGIYTLKNKKWYMVFTDENKKIIYKKII